MSKICKRGKVREGHTDRATRGNIGKERHQNVIWDDTEDDGEKNKGQNKDREDRMREEAPMER